MEENSTFDVIQELIGFHESQLFRHINKYNSLRKENPALGRKHLNTATAYQSTVQLLEMTEDLIKDNIRYNEAQEAETERLSESRLILPDDSFNYRD